MDAQALRALLDNLIAGWENEVAEFKRAGNDYSTDNIGKYFSALANEANLRNQERAWLVFGVDNNTRKAVGTDYRVKPDHLQSLKMQISDATEPSITLRNIHELLLDEGRVLLFEIPAAPLGLPIAWKGHYYARAGESLTHLGLDKLDEIRRQVGAADWSAQAVAGATLDHLDASALSRARESFAKKYANRFTADEVKQWSDSTFLDRAKLTRDGQITRTTLLLLGKLEAAHLLSPHPAQMTWKLEGSERAYEHFGLPFLLNSSGLYQKIRNIQIRILPEDQLLAIELAKYDQKIVLEALHNCIAHQDYSRNGRIIVTEYPDRLVLENEGSFFEGQPADYISGSKTPRRYRNPFLAQAMAELNMIDTMGYGIHEMHLGQARRFFPMPDYDLSEPKSVKMTIHGRVVDQAYSRLLIQKTDLALGDILALDRVQKKLPLDDAMVKHLRKAGLIEGRKPNLYVSASIAKATASKAEYIRTRGLDDGHYKQLIIDLLTQFGSASRQDIDRLLLSKLSDALDEQQKLNKVGNLLTSLRRAGRITNSGPRKAPLWVLAE
ncbi:RNA-binding domain-containing protein [Stutzerimonas stutzeri]|uniref:Transcriptional regulator n=1 Tax=Stutzerimonas stutzeri TaxID=316 RepID=A0A2N8RDP0_STUST|nr:RNA-binding domain-containing protein [Stutzerimonas stutzeri]MCQ4254562.1 putative DNA binding domain-containing protein [Stutzerimonas stutzeri]PNF59204.1 transcriptional regulator [Stutzerimonas stutzeri]